MRTIVFEATPYRASEYFVYVVVAGRYYSALAASEEEAKGHIRSRIGEQSPPE